MSSQEVGTGYVSIVPSFKGGNKAIEAELNRTNVDKVSAGLGKRFTSRFKSVLKGGLALGTLFAGLTAKKGLDRLMGIEDARASLAGLGHDAKAVDKVMQNALDAVRGTAFGLADAAKVAASAVAAGVKPGKDLTDNLRLVADAATIAKAPLNEMGAIFNKVAAANKIQGEVIHQLNDRGIPIIQLLSKQLGKSAAETIKLASQGKVNFETFSRAMQDGVGGAALKSGETLRGSFANMMASVSRVGANFLSGVYPKFAKGFQGITELLGPIEEKAGKAGQKLGELVNIAWDKLQVGADAIKAFFDSAAGHAAIAVSVDLISKAGNGLREAFQGAADAVGQLKNNLAGIDFSNLDARQIGELLGDAIASGLENIGKAAGTIGEAIVDVVGKINWGELGLELGRQAPTLLLGLATGILNFDFEGLFDFLGDHLLEVVLGVLTTAFAPAKLIGPIAKILGRIPFVGRFLAWIVTSLNQAGSKVLGYVVDFLKYFWRGFTEAAPAPGAALASLAKRVIAIFRGIPARIRNAIDYVKTWLGVRGLELAQSLGRGVRSGFSRVGDFLKSIPGRMLGLLRALTPNFLREKGTSVITGLRAGITNRFTRVVEWFKNLPARILVAAGDLSEILVKAGEKVIDGLVQGIRNGFDKVKGALGDLTGKLTDWKGPPARDRRILTPAGLLIMRGLVDGLDKGTSGVEKYFSRVTDLISKAVDTKKISAAQGKALNKLVAQQRRALNKVARQIEATQQRISDLVQQRRDLAGSLKDSLTGELDLGGLASKPRLRFSDVGGAVSGLAGRVKAFAGKLAALLKAGIPPALVAEVAALGTDAGTKVADALLSGSSSDVRQLQTDFAALNRYSKQVGDIVAGGMFNAGIAAQKEILDGLLDDKAIIKAAQVLANKLPKAITAALTAKAKGKNGKALAQAIQNAIADPKTQAQLLGYVGKGLGTPPSTTAGSNTNLAGALANTTSSTGDAASRPIYVYDKSGDPSRTAREVVRREAFEGVA